MLKHNGDGKSGVGEEEPTTKYIKLVPAPQMAA